jgi:hypothetical protein
VTNPSGPFVEIELLNNMVYDPFDANDTDDESIFNSIDPDQNFLGEIRGKAISSCKYYYSTCQLDKMLGDKRETNTTILQLNIRSVPKNLETLVTTLESSNMDMDIIGLSETWLKASNADSYGIKGYSHEFLTREDKPGGGSSLFIKDTWTYKVRADLSYINTDSEMLWIEVDKDSSLTPTNLLIGTIYRRPGSTPTEFNQKLQNTLALASLEKKK